MALRPVLSSWYLSFSTGGTDYVLSVMPITTLQKEQIASTRSWWAKQLLPALDRCNSFTFAKRGFSSSIGYLAFDMNKAVGQTTVGAALVAAMDANAIITLTMRYTQDGVVTDKPFYRLYIESTDVYHTQFGSGAIGIVKLVDNRYYGPILAPLRNSTHTFSTYSSDARAKDLFYTGFNGPDWESTSPAEFPTIYEQLKYWQPAFRNWTITMSGGGLLSGGGISVSPQSETAYGCFRRLIEYPYSTTFCDLQINSADGHASIVEDVPLPSDQSSYGPYITNGYYSYKSAASTGLFEVLFPLNRKNVWNTETVNSNFRIRYQSPYTQPTRVPSGAYLAYYPSGVPSGTTECISIVSDVTAVPDREASKANGPVGTDIANADKYDFDYSGYAAIGDAEVTKYLANNKAYSFFQSQTQTGFIDSYTYGTTSALICGARYLWGEELSTEVFWGVRFQVREQPVGLPLVGVAEQVQALQPIDANFTQRQLGEQAFEELQIPYTSWSGHTEVKMYGHSTYSAGSYTPSSTTSCDALYGIGEAKVVHARLDENTGETDSLGISESHVLVKSRDLIVGVNFVGYQMQDGHYRPIDQPSIRCGSVLTRWDTAVVPTAATSTTDMHQKFLSPYFKQTLTRDGNITDPTPLIFFDRQSFRVFDVGSTDDYINTALYPNDVVDATMAFITSANRILLGKTYTAIPSEDDGTVRIYDGTAGSEAAVLYGAAGTYVEVTAWNHGLSEIPAGTWVFVVEINDQWYVVPCDTGSGIYWGRTDEAGTKDGVSFTVSRLIGTGTGTDTTENFEVVSKISDIASGADCYFARPVGVSEYHLINGECL